MKKRIASVVMIVILASSVLCPVIALAAEIGGEYISSHGACVLDFDSGEVLYEYNGYISRVPASMTKIMTVYCVYEAIKENEIKLDTVVPISENVYKLARMPDYSNVTLNYDTVYTVDEMLDSLIVCSANACAVALAELLDGSEEEFVKRMNTEVWEMGISAYFYDSYGIADNLITPVAMAQLARNLIRDYPQVLTRSAKKSFNFHGKTYNSTNRLFDRYYYEGADGLKSGTTTAAGYCFCGTAERNGRRMISVTMHSSSSDQRFVDTTRLLDYGFANARELVILPDGNFITSRSAIVVDCETGEELYAYKPDEKKNVDSMATLLSAYVIMDALEKGEMTMGSAVNVSERAYNLSLNGQEVKLAYGESYTLGEMLDMIAMFSSPSCTLAVAEALCGNEAAFVERMNAKLAEAGIDAAFYNCTGVNNDQEAGKESLMSAREAAMLVKMLITKHPAFLEKAQQQYVEFHGTIYYNPHKLPCGYYGVNAPLSMGAVAQNNKRQAIAVTLSSGTKDACYNDITKLLDYGMSLAAVEAVTPTEPVIPTKKPDENLLAKSNVTVSVNGVYEINFSKPILAEGGVVLVPVRDLMEALGKSVAWDNSEKCVVVNDGDMKALLTPGSGNMKIIRTNGGSVSESITALKAPCRLIDGTAYAPVEAIEVFGVEVVWEEALQRVLIIPVL